MYVIIRSISTDFLFIYVVFCSIHSIKITVLVVRSLRIDTIVHNIIILFKIYIYIILYYNDGCRLPMFVHNAERTSFAGNPIIKIIYLLCLCIMYNKVV